MKSKCSTGLSCIASLGISALPSSILQAQEIQVTVSNRILHTLDPRVFGQFLERPSWGKETGPEGFADEKGNLPENIVTALEKMAIPILRFPGGTDVDRTDWTDLIDIPGRKERPMTQPTPQNLSVSNRFGWLEYARLRDRLRCQTIAVVNLGDGLFGKRTVEDAAKHAAGLVAFLNAPVGAKLPEGMPDWPSIRAASGHKDPVGVEFVQIGNETWFFGGQLDLLGWPKEPAERVKKWLSVLHAYIVAIRAVDPKVELIVDGWAPEGMAEGILSDPTVRKEVKWAAMHAYGPGPAQRATRNGADIPVESVDAENWWRFWVGCFIQHDSQGRPRTFDDKVWDPAVRLGYRVAATEWNWNGWGAEQLDSASRSRWRLSGGLGAGAFCHGLIRDGDRVGLAAQSMLVGQSWAIAALKREKDGRITRSPQGQATTLHCKHHGTQVLETAMSGAEIWQQEIGGTWNGPRGAVASADAVATVSGKDLFIHLLNRQWSKEADFNLNLPAGWSAAEKGTLYRLNPAPDIDPKEPWNVPPSGAWFAESEESIKPDGKCWRVRLPPASMGVLQITAKP